MQLSAQTRMRQQVAFSASQRSTAAVKPCVNMKQHRQIIARAAVAGAEMPDGVTIRRLPPQSGSAVSKPRDILEEIVWYKAVEVAAMQAEVPVQQLQEEAKKAPAPRDFRGAIVRRAKETGKPGLIAECKKASPSKGVIQPDFDPVRIAKSYEAGGAACLSVLTDKKFFQGGFENLRLIRGAGVSCPLLCKEFIVDNYQVVKARASGADAILLIAAVLPNQDMASLMEAACALGMQCLIEVHTAEELARVLRLPGVERHMLGINNRDLGTFKVDLGLTARLMQGPEGQEVKQRGIIMVGESGIFTPEDVAFVQQAGVGAILVGESLVKQGDPAKGVKQLLSLA